MNRLAGIAILMVGVVSGMLLAGYLNPVGMIMETIFPRKYGAAIMWGVISSHCTPQSSIYR